MFRTLRWFGACTGLALLVSFMIGIAAPAGAGAQESGGWTLAPTATPGVGEAARPYFLYSATPGETLSDSVTLYNTTDQALRFRLYPSDAFNTKKGGGYALNTSPQTPKHAGAWIKLPVVEFAAQAKSAVQIPFTIDVPADATPGDTSAGIVALNLAPEGSTKKNGVNLDVRRAIGARVYIDVDGPRHPELSIPDLALDSSKPLLAPVASSDGGTVSLTVANTGNTRLSPKVKVWVTDAFGKTVKSFAPVTLRDLLPGGKAELEKSWSSGSRLPLRLTAHATATTATADTEASASQLVIPWLLVILLLVLVALAVWWYRRRRARSNQAATAGA
jgi:hypothetical protein